MKKGEILPIGTGARYVSQNMAHAIPDIYAALVEIVTNADDSYGCLYRDNKIPLNGGDILIEMQRRVNSPSLLIVRDKAEGLTLDAMRTNFTTLGGEVTAGKGARGYMARGLKDCIARGEIRVDSIVDGRHYACCLSRNPDTQSHEFRVEEIGRKASDSVKRNIGVSGGKNGTMVTLVCNSETSFPNLATVRNLLPMHYALRDIFDENGPSKVLIRKDKSDKAERLVFPALKGVQEVDERFTVENYPEAECHLRIWRSPVPLKDENRIFRRSGILVKSERGIHECTLFGHDDEVGMHYYGRLECPYIDALLREFDAGKTSTKNPSFLLDPSRRHGLSQQHPFTRMFYKRPKARLIELIDRDRRARRERQTDVANEDMRRKFDKVSRLMDQIWKEYVGEPDPTPGEERSFDAARLNGIVIYPPPGFKIAVGETRSVTVYISASRYHPDRKTRMQIVNEGNISSLDSFSGRRLKPHPKASDIVYGSCRIKGTSVGETPIIVRHGKDLRAESLGVVVKGRKEDDRDFESPLEFERKKYLVAENTTKTLRIFGDVLKIGRKEGTVAFSSGDDGCVTVMGGRHCTLVPRSGFNFAEGEIKIKGTALTEKPVTITARLGDWSATAKISVKPKKNFGGGFRTELVEESLGVFRARWKLDEPHVLQISAVHPSVKPYLGSPDDEWPGQSSCHFQMLLAEIVVEAFCNKLLEGEMRGSRADRFQFSPDMDPPEVLHTLNREFHKKVNELAVKVHKIFLSPDCFG